MSTTILIQTLLIIGISLVGYVCYKYGKGEAINNINKYRVDYDSRLKEFYDNLDKLGYDKKYFPISNSNRNKSIDDNYNRLAEILMNDIIQKSQGVIDTLKND